MRTHQNGDAPAPPRLATSMIRNNTPLLAGLICTPIFGVLAICLFFFPDRPVSPRGIEVVSGQIERAEVLSLPRAQTLQIWLAGETTPFRAAGAFLFARQRAILPLLTPRTTIQMGVLATEMESARRDRMQSNNFMTFYSLRVNNEPVFTLDDSNHRFLIDQAGAKIVFPLLLAGSISSLVYGLRRARHDRAS